jgi:hypothetical protein
MRPSMRLALLSGLFVCCFSILQVASAAVSSPRPLVSPAATAPPLTADGGGWDYPYYGTPTVEYVEIRASAAVTISGTALTGANGASYSIVSNTCAATTLPAGGSCEIAVNLSATALGFLYETLEVDTNFGPYDVALSAYVQPAPLVVSPATLDFGFQPVGTVSAPKTLTVTNPNPVPNSINYDYSLPVGPFDVTDQCGPIPARGTCKIGIAFRPASANAAIGHWSFATAQDAGGGSYIYEPLTWTGTGVLNSAASIDFFALQNVTAFGAASAHTRDNGLDGLGNTYAVDFFSNTLNYGGKLFTIGNYTGLTAVSNITLPAPAGPYFALSLLATAVRGNQPNQPFVLTYSDGTTEVLHQSLSDWHTPQKYAGESVALAMPYRYTVDGMQHAGPYYLYAYTLPINHMKTLASIKLPGRSVVVLAANLEVNGVPTSVDLHEVFNVSALDAPGTPIPGPGIDRLGGAIDLSTFYSQTSPLDSIFNFNYAPPPNNAVANATVELPARTFSKLDLLALGVRGNQANQTLIVTYTDGTTTVLHQSFSDWHTPQNYPGESLGIAMPHRLNQDGSEHPGMYNVYQYRFALDATKTVASLKLPANVNVVTLAVSLEP